MQKTRPYELHRIRFKDCPNFKFLNHHCHKIICQKHLKLKLEIGGDDWQYGGDLDTLGGVEESQGESRTENEDTITEEESEQEESEEEQGEEEDDAIPEDIDYEDESRKKVFEWLKRIEELERTSKR
jgi:hypothetical protein